MLNRRILRIKAFKVLYSYAENPSMTLKEAETQLEISCESTRDLYLFMLSIIIPLTKEAKDRIEAAKNKFNPTEEEKNPNLKFVNNRISPVLEQDLDFQKIISRKKLSWDQYDVLLRKLYESIKTKQYFKDYMSSEECSLKEDAALFAKIFEEEFVDNEDLESILEDLSIYWNDDLAYALTYCCHTMKDFADGKRWALYPLYQSDMNPDKNVQSDKSFVTNLLRHSYANFEKYGKMVAESVPKWDKDRLFTTDVVLIVCGLAEAEHFPDIPVKVTINEFVEISKFYSTPKSSSFVNGLLDKIIKNELNLLK